MAKKLTFDYKVHRGAPHTFTVPAKLVDGTDVEATVDGFEAELVPVDGVQGTIRFSFPAGSEDAALLLVEGAKVTVTVG